MLFKFPKYYNCSNEYYVGHAGALPSIAMFNKKSFFFLTVN